MKAQLKVQERLIEHTQATRDAILGLETKLTNPSSRYSNVSIPDAVTVATEHQSQIDNARDLIKKGRPGSALDLLEDLKQRIWTNASPIVKYHILTNIAATQFALNKEEEGAKLLLKAFQYNPEDETALSNRALAHFLLGETEKAADYAKKALDKSPVNTNAHVILVEISSDEETLEEVIDKVPEYLRKVPQIAYAISNIAKQRQNLERSKKMGRNHGRA